MMPVTLERKTKETDIKVTMRFDDFGSANIHTGVGFFDHMLTALAVHSGISMDISCGGDLHVDCHHTIEDVGIVLGKVFADAVTQRLPIARFGSAYIPMDEALAFTALDISNRPYLVFEGGFTADRVGEMDCQMVEEFFRAFAFQAGITLHVRILYGQNDHHKIEAAFKSLAHALKMAIVPLKGQEVLSTKGVL